MDARTADCDDLGSASNKLQGKHRVLVHGGTIFIVHRDRLGAEGRLQPKDLCLHHHRLHVAVSPSSRGRRVSGQVPETDLPPFTQLVQEPGAIFVCAQREVLLKEQVVVRSIIPSAWRGLLVRGGLICHRDLAAAHSERKTRGSTRKLEHTTTGVGNAGCSDPEPLEICLLRLSTQDHYANLGCYNE